MEPVSDLAENVLKWKVWAFTKISLYSAVNEIMYTVDGIARYYRRQPNPVNSETGQIKNRGTNTVTPVCGIL